MDLKLSDNLFIDAPIGLEFNIANRLTDIGIQQDIGNQQIGTQEVGLRNAQTSGVFGNVSGLFNRLGNIQSSIQPITTQLNLDRANLAGQPSMRAGQNLLNSAVIGNTFNTGQSGQQNSFLDFFKNLFSGGNQSGAPTGGSQFAPGFGASGSQTQFGRDCFNPKTGEIIAC